MALLFVKIPRGNRGRFHAWPSPEEGTPCITPGGRPITEPEAMEFALIERAGKENGLGAGGQYEYRKLFEIGTRAGTVAIVRAGPRLRAQVPDACHLLDVATGAFTGVYHSEAQAEAARKGM